MGTKGSGSKVQSSATVSASVSEKQELVTREMLLFCFDVLNAKIRKLRPPSPPTFPEGEQ
jgi:hypothetical protein